MPEGGCAGWPRATQHDPCPPPPLKMAISPPSPRAGSSMHQRDISHNPEPLPGGDPNARLDAQSRNLYPPTQRVGPHALRPRRTRPLLAAVSTLGSGMKVAHPLRAQGDRRLHLHYVTDAWTSHTCVAEGQEGVMTCSYPPGRESGIPAGRTERLACLPPTLSVCLADSVPVVPVPLVAGDAQAGLGAVRQLVYRGRAGPSHQAPLRSRLRVQSSSSRG